MRARLHLFLTILILVLPSAAFGGKEGQFKSTAKDRGTELLTATFKSGRSCEVLLNRKADRNYVPINRAALARLLSDGGHLVSDKASNRADVNCHGFSCQKLRVPYLPSNVWIEPGDFRTLLLEYFLSQPVEWFSYEKNWAGVQSFDQNPKVKAGDLVVLALGRMIQHSGIVAVEGGRKLILSKLDEEMVAVATLENLVERYGINAVGVFRKE